MTIEQLAEELHKFYRAAFKALSVHGEYPDMTESCKGHDHGWSHCNKQKYFQNRARILMEALKKGLYCVTIEAEPEPKPKVNMFRGAR